MQIIWARRWRGRDAAVGMAGRHQPQFARGRAIQQPRGQHTLIDDRQLFDSDAFGVKRLGAEPSHPQRIVDDANIVGKQLLSEAVFEETGLARNRGAVHGADEMADQRTRNPGIEHHRHLAGLDLARIGACHRTLAGLSADAFARCEIGSVWRGRVVVIAFHAGAVADDGGHRNALARTQVRAVESSGGHQHHSANSGRRRRAARFGDTLYGERGGFSFIGAAFKLRRRRGLGIEQIEVWKLPRQ